jgi:hypothetical protein
MWSDKTTLIPFTAPFTAVRLQIFIPSRPDVLIKDSLARKLAPEQIADSSDCRKKNNPADDQSPGGQEFGSWLRSVNQLLLFPSTFGWIPAHFPLFLPCDKNNL